MTRTLIVLETLSFFCFIGYAGSGKSDPSQHFESVQERADTAGESPEPTSDEPFAWGDFTWLQGNSRLHKQVLDSKYFTGDMTMDMNYNFSFNHPIDHTNAGSTATFRSDEFNVSYIEVGGDFHDPESGARARLMLQFGTRSTGVPRNDATPLRGQFDLYTALRYVTEGYIGMHINSMHGVNVDVGIFKSYVGLLSYNNFENWNYQPSFTSDNTPWFFTGVRIQTFPTDRLKLEYWVINGWQTYAMFNEQPGIGFQTIYRPHEWISILASAYGGWDTPNTPGRFRFHSDNSILICYRNKPGSTVPKAAFSLTGEWRILPHLTLNYGLRYEVNTPYTEIRNRLNAWAPGKQSTIYSNAPAGLLFPGDPGVPAGIAPVDYKEFM